MHSLTVPEGSLLGLGVVAVAALLVLGVFRAFPRSRRTISTVVTCPTIGRPARADLVWDLWTRRSVDVTRCSVLGGHGVVFCRKACLRDGEANCLGG
jgi:hypothetical protein